MPTPWCQIESGVRICLYAWNMLHQQRWLAARQHPFCVVSDCGLSAWYAPGFSRYGISARSESITKASRSTVTVEAARPTIYSRMSVQHLFPRCQSSPCQPCYYARVLITLCVMSLCASTPLWH
jgi:hypothetical protein